MRRLLVVAACGALLVGITGCRIGECWRYAWNSRRQQQQAVIVTEPCVVTDSPCCDPCGGAVITTSPCTSCGQ